MNNRLPYIMAKVKPYDYQSRHFSWQSIIRPMSDKKPFEDIAARIKWHRELEGLNQQGYADAAGIKRSQLSNWESGMQRISIDGARCLRRTFGLSLDFIYEGIDDTLSMTLRKAWRESPSVKKSK